MRRSIFILFACLLALNVYAQKQELNPVLKNIFERKSVRTYSVNDKGEPKAISKDTLDLIVRAAMAAPSAMNKQPWEFYVVLDTAKMRVLAKGLPYAKMLKMAGAAIVVLGDPSVGKLWEHDCSAATENMLLAIESLGLGGVWTAAFPYEERVNAVRTTLNIPDNLIPLCVVPIGYPAGKTSPKDKWKPEKIHYIK